MASSSPRRCTTVMTPVVRVPVLSSTTVSIWRVDSRTSGPRTSTPIVAPRPVPTSSAVGVASPSAQGHAMTSTATAAVKPCCHPVVSPQPSSVSSAMTRTTGTNTAETRSASRCTGALPLCAAVTSAVMRASAVSLPTRVARSTSSPSCTTVPPETESPGPTSTGTDSPVSMLASIADEPSTTSPSVAMRSPGRTTTRSPTFTCAAGTSASPAGVRTRATVGARSSRARSAAPERRFARCSSQRPTSRKVVTTAADSK